MSTTRAEAAYRRSAAAFRNPMLGLLHGRYAPFVVAVLSVVFTADRATVAVSDAHAEIAEVIDQLRGAGYDHDERRIPSGTAREICRYWVKVGWLVPQIEDDVEVYRLSAQAVGALEVAGRAGGGRTRVSQSRVRTLLESVDRLSVDADDDRDARIARLRADRDQLDAEIVRLEGGGDVEPLDEEQLLEEAENILHLARELPADFSRVAESINAMQRDVVTALRQDVRPTGEVLREYLQRGQHIMQATPEGRAFAGALRLIGEPEHIDHLADQLHTLMAKPFARLLAVEQRADLRAISRRVELGVEEVLTAQRRASHVITAQVRTHDPIRDRQVDDLLRDVMAGLQTWMQTSRPGDRIDPLRSFPVADVGHLRQSLSDIRPPGAPDKLTEVDGDAVDFLDADERSWGGPHYAELERYVASLGDTFDLGAAFEDGPAANRRPVDLLGLLEIAHRNGMTEGDDVTIVEALRPDGTRRRFAFGSVTARTTKEQSVD